MVATTRRRAEPKQPAAKSTQDSTQSKKRYFARKRAAVSAAAASDPGNAPPARSPSDKKQPSFSIWLGSVKQSSSGEEKKPRASPTLPVPRKQKAASSPVGRLLKTDPVPKRPAARSAAPPSNAQSASPSHNHQVERSPSAAMIGPKGAGRTAYFDTSEEDDLALDSPQKTVALGARSSRRIFQAPPVQSSPQQHGRKMTKCGEGRRSRGISERDKALIMKTIRQSNESAMILNTAQFRPSKRRPRVPWTAAEINYLRLGVEKFGQAWLEIRKHEGFSFNPHRTDVDLKDKWRNLTNYQPYSSHGKRTFVLLDENHQAMIRPDTGKPYRFSNRWPRDAALKAASKSELYEDARNTTTIYVREVDSDAIRDAAIPPIVHVYEGTRRQEVAPPHLNDLRICSVWVSQVCKIREERFVSRDDLKKLEQQKESL